MSDRTTTRLNLRYHWKAVLLWAIGIGGALVLAICTMMDRAEAWVEGYQPFPEGSATVLVHRFCRASNCDYSNDIPQRYWEAAIDNAARAWSNAGSNFRFSFERFSADANHDPCQPRDGYVYVILADPGPLCPGEALPDVGGIAYSGSGWSRVYISSDHEGGEPHLRRLLVHEFGHVVGLGHPNEHGQYVRAIMNSHLGFGAGSGWVPLDELQPDDITGILNLYGALGVLENPRPGSYQSGLGVISGWVCEAGTGGVGVYIDNQVVYPAADGTERLDTQDVCGDTDNGFGLLFNWNRLGDGEHTVVALASGVEIGRATFTVTTLGEEFLRGVTGTGTIALSDGKQVTVKWDEALQGFTIIDFVEGDEDEEEDNTSGPIPQLSFDAFWGNWEFTSPIGTFEWRVFQVNEDSAYAHVDSPGFSEPTGFLTIGSAASSNYPAVLTAGYDYVASWRPGSYCYLYAFSLTDEEMTEGEVWRWRQSDLNVCGPAPTSGQSYAAKTYRK